jgi:hypothetical protein
MRVEVRVISENGSYEAVAVREGMPLDSQPRLAVSLVPKQGRSEASIAKWLTPLVGLSIRTEVEEDFFEDRERSSAFLLSVLQTVSLRKRVHSRG